jgi:polysaccharide export outer membrane protein
VTPRSIAPALAAALCFAGCAGISLHVGDPSLLEEKPEQPPAETVESKPKESPPAVENKEARALEDALQYVEDQRHSYRVGAADLLKITVYQEPELQRKVRVSPEGIITFPLVGRVPVAGLSVAGAEDALKKKLARYLIDPQVSIFIEDYGNKTIYVLGEVKKPGSYPLPTEAPLTVLEAITLAGGFTEYASVDRTRIIRKGKSGKRTIDIEVSAIMKKGDKSKDLPLKPNDVVYIPESFF